MFVPVDGDCQAQQDGVGLAWLSPADARRQHGGRDDGRARCAAATGPSPTSATDPAKTGNATVVSANDRLGVALPFAGSLEVEVRDAPNPSALPKYWAAWTTTHTKSVGRPPLIVIEVDGQQLLRERAEFGDESSRYVVD